MIWPSMVWVNIITLRFWKKFDFQNGGSFMKQFAARIMHISLLYLRDEVLYWSFQGNRGKDCIFSYIVKVWTGRRCGQFVFSGTRIECTGRLVHRERRDFIWSQPYAQVKASWKRCSCCWLRQNPSCFPAKKGVFVLIKYNVTIQRPVQDKKSSSW